MASPRLPGGFRRHFREGLLMSLSVHIKRLWLIF
jgi:hypothetical protein